MGICLGYLPGLFKGHCWRKLDPALQGWVLNFFQNVLIRDTLHPTDILTKLSLPGSPPPPHTCPLRHHPKNHSAWWGWWELSVWQRNLNYFCPYSSFSLLCLCISLPDERQLISQKSAWMILLAVQNSFINKRQMISQLSRGQNYSDLEFRKTEASRICQKC